MDFRRLMGTILIVVVLGILIIGGVYMFRFFGML